MNDVSLQTLRLEDEGRPKRNGVPKPIYFPGAVYDTGNGDRTF
jgi:hypothetical protein